MQGLKKSVFYNKTRKKRYLVYWAIFLQRKFVGILVAASKLNIGMTRMMSMRFVEIASRGLVTMYERPGPWEKCNPGFLVQINKLCIKKRSENLREGTLVMVIEYESVWKPGLTKQIYQLFLWGDVHLVVVLPNQEMSLSGFVVFI